MIKANELRIGNRIYLELALPGLNIHEVHAQDIADISNGRITLASISPIQLTPDILEKCGFEKDSDYWEPFDGDAKGVRYICGDMEVIFLKTTGRLHRMESANGDEFGYFYGPELKSLHQLQNLYFALTGEELEVKL